MSVFFERDKHDSVADDKERRELLDLLREDQRSVSVAMSQLKHWIAMPLAAATEGYSNKSDGTSNSRSSSSGLKYKRLLLFFNHFNSFCRTRRPSSSRQAYILICALDRVQSFCRSITGVITTTTTTTSTGDGTQQCESGLEQQQELEQEIKTANATAGRTVLRLLLYLRSLMFNNSNNYYYYDKNPTTVTGSDIFEIDSTLNDDGIGVSGDSHCGGVCIGGLRTLGLSQRYIENTEQVIYQLSAAGLYTAEETKSSLQIIADLKIAKREKLKNLPTEEYTKDFICCSIIKLLFNSMVATAAAEASSSAAAARLPGTGTGIEKGAEEESKAEQRRAEEDIFYNACEIYFLVKYFATQKGDWDSNSSNSSNSDKYVSWCLENSIYATAISCFTVSVKCNSLKLKIPSVERILMSYWTAVRDISILKPPFAPGERESMLTSVTANEPRILFALGYFLNFVGAAAIRGGERKRGGEEEEEEASIMAIGARRGIASDILKQAVVLLQHDPYWFSGLCVRVNTKHISCAAICIAAGYSYEMTEQEHSALFGDLSVDKKIVFETICELNTMNFDVLPEIRAIYSVMC